MEAFQEGLMGISAPEVLLSTNRDSRKLQVTSAAHLLLYPCAWPSVGSIPTCCGLSGVNCHSHPMVPSVPFQTAPAFHTCDWHCLESRFTHPWKTLIHPSVPRCYFFCKISLLICWEPILSQCLCHLAADVQFGPIPEKTVSIVVIYFWHVSVASQIFEQVQC